MRDPDRVPTVRVTGDAIEVAHDFGDGKCSEREPLAARDDRRRNRLHRRAREHEDDALRAVRAALAIHSRTRRLGEAAGELGFRAGFVRPNPYNNKMIDHPDYEPFWAAAAAFGDWLLRRTLVRYRHFLWVAALGLSLVLPKYATSETIAMSRAIIPAMSVFMPCGLLSK